MLNLTRADAAKMTYWFPGALLLPHLHLFPSFLLLNKTPTLLDCGFWKWSHPRAKDRPR